MTRTCFDRCFNAKQSSIDSDKVTACYHKYINTINQIEHLTRKIGKQAKSEFIIKGYSLDKDYISSFIFPRGGTKFMSILVTLKYFDDLIIYPVTGYNPYKDNIEQS